MIVATNEIVVLIVASLSYKHFKIGGQWKCMIDARRIHEGPKVLVGSALVGMNETLYFSVKHI